ncbi:M3 family oligoendopeptidase [Ureibacillus chungkukjangi]|uniref:M3 family oligoendopeptidase n=1 Tax=Ureibacillus chungkukjangi TaxID=1202712 RepID=UPI0020412DFE|nr:M3 family oligoendopeptidase [Ureibacillus chungkukjangi]MCM3387135.1 M3 family oligoendopeptidase [Ureibacillus chungkukjangi]
MKQTRYSMTWNLDEIFEGGSNSSQLKEHNYLLEEKLNNLEDLLVQLNKLGSIDSEIIVLILNNTADIRISLSQSTSFIICLQAQDSKAPNVSSLRGTTALFNARFENLIKKFQTSLFKINQLTWEDLVENESLIKYKFVLNEWRNKANILLSEQQESLVSDLMIDGYHAWGEFYNTLISNTKVKVQIDDLTKELSVGQTINLRSHPKEHIRKTAHYALEEILQEKEVLFSQILNHIAGFRLQVYKHKGVDNVLSEPLIENRIKPETIEAMWTAVNKYKDTFINYLDVKSKYYGHQKMHTYNFWAPIGNFNRKIEYEDAVNFILRQFSQFGDELASFAQNAFQNGWIEAEDRPDKSPAAFCASFPKSNESRILMTYGDRITSVLTLAHELGHAFHNHAMKSVDGINRQYPISIAETASTFSELLILNAELEQSESKEEKLFLLDEKLKRSVMNFMNIQSRFLFERKFYEERKQGNVSSRRLNELMKEAIDIAYEGSLEDVSEHSWAWTPHFYLTNSPFYNFQYTFGYLLSISLYSISKQKGKEFETNFIKLLRDSGSLSMEALVMKHLEEDITSEDFWENGMKICVEDVEEFIILIS